MSVVLRIVGCFWILYSFQPLLKLARRLLASGVHLQVGINDFLNILMLSGGIGLLLLREWGRWLILIGCVAFLLLKAGGPLLQLRFPPGILRPLIFYGISIVLLMLPSSRSVTRK